MGVKDYRRTAAHTAEQKARTKANKINRYSVLIETKSSDPHVNIWKRKLEMV